MLMRICKFARTPSFFLAIALIIVLLLSTSMVVGQGNLSGFAYLPIIMDDSPGAPPPGADGWPMVAANPQRTSWTPEEVSGSLQLQWYRPVEAYIPQNSQIIAAHGLLYVSTASGLLALDAATGALAWRYDTELPLGNSPTIANGVAYVGGYDRKLHALNAQTGAYLWSYAGAGAGYAANPVVVNGRVYVGNRDGTMYAIGAHGTAQQGRVVWQYDTGAPIYFSAAYDNGKIYFASGNYGYALNANTGTLAWRSEMLPAESFQSYWPVVFQDKVVFTGSDAYRNGEPGLGSVQDQDGVPYGKFIDVERDDLFAGLSDGDRIGNTVPDQPWANGRPVLDASRILQYYEDNPTSHPDQHKPWRRVMIVLNAADGSEYTFDTDGDGHGEYIPAAYVGGQSGNRYPPLVGPDNRLYFLNVLEKLYIPQGQVMGWQTGTQYVSLVGLQGAVDEPQAISAGGNIIYRNLCCDRVADWASIADSQGGALWSYNLEELAPGYDNQTWEILPGWPRLQGWYTGSSGSVNAAYHNHGDQNPIIPYEGRLYVHRSNVIFAFGEGAGAGALPLLEANEAQSASSSLGEAQLRARLEDEIQKMIDAGPLRPGYYTVAQFQYNALNTYFENPGDTIYTLAMAYPHLSAELQNQLRPYLQQEFNAYFNPTMYATTGWNRGAARESMQLPPEVAADLAHRGPAAQSGGFAWQYPQHNFYAMWKYAEIFPSQALTVYDLARSRLQVPLPSHADDQYLRMQPFEHNAWIAGYIGFLELQEMGGMSGTDSQLRSQVSSELQRLLNLRVSLFSKDSYWFDERFYKKHLDTATNFMFLVPELGDFMHQNMLSQVQQAVDEYEHIAPYWFVSRYEAAIGEGALHNLYPTVALFSARAYALQQSRAELTKYLDVPAFARGDLFYIQNIVAALEAE